MNTSTLGYDERVKNVDFDEGSLHVELMDGRHVNAPLVWYPRLANASPEQRLRWVLCAAGYGIHWEELDEDVNTEVLLRQQPEAEKYIAQRTHS